MAGKPQRTPIAVRLAPDELSSLDALVVSQRRDHPGPAWTRSDVLRAILLGTLPPLRPAPEGA